MVLKLESEKRAEIRSNILRNADCSEVLDARTEANQDLLVLDLLSKLERVEIAE